MGVNLGTRRSVLSDLIECSFMRMLAHPNCKYLVFNIVQGKNCLVARFLLELWEYPTGITVKPHCRHPKSYGVLVRHGGSVPCPTGTGIASLVNSTMLVVLFAGSMSSSCILEPTAPRIMPTHSFNGLPSVVVSPIR